MSPNEEKLLSALTSLSARLDSLPPEALRQAQDLIEQTRLLRERRALQFYAPNAPQRRYQDAALDPEGFIVIFAAPNGIGKTAATIALIAAIIWPELAQADAFGDHWVQKDWPYPKDFRIVSTPQELEDGGSIQREIKRWFPQGEYEARKNGATYPSQFLARGFTINLLSYKMAPEAFEGATCGLIAFNEPPPQAIFNACAARMRRGGRLLFPMTPLMDAAWIMDTLVSRSSASDKYVQLVGADIEENCRDHAPNGILSHADIERMIRGYDPDEVDARVHGKFIHLSGVVWKAFDRAVHVAKEPIVPPTEGVSHYQVVDPAIGKPLAVLWAYADATGTVHIYDEWPEFDFQGSKDSNQTVTDYVQLFKAREEGRTIGTRILDRYFGNARRTLGGNTLRQEFAEAGLWFVDSYSVGNASSEVETGILKVKDYMRYDKTKPIDALNRPRLVISPTCRNTILALERWSRDPQTSKPKEEYKDFGDLLRYLCMAEPSFDKPTTWAQGGQGHYGVGT